MTNSSRLDKNINILGDQIGKSTVHLLGQMGAISASCNIKKMSANIQLHTGSTLPKALKSARQDENIRQQQAELRQDVKSGASVKTVGKSEASTTCRSHNGCNKCSSRRPENHGQDDTIPTRTNRHQFKQKCPGCKQAHHIRQFRPCRQETYQSCHEKCHLSAFCHSKEMFFIGLYGDNEVVGDVGAFTRSQPDSLEVIAMTQRGVVTFEIDRAADDIVMSPSNFRKLSPRYRPR